MDKTVFSKLKNILKLERSDAKMYTLMAIFILWYVCHQLKRKKNNKRGNF